MKLPPLQSRSAAFTVSEGLVAIGILGVLAVLTVGVATKVGRSSVLSAQCSSNLRQMGVAMSLYAADHGGQLPVLAGDAEATDRDLQNGKGNQWDMQIFPYVSPRNAVAKRNQTDTVFFCPASHPDPSYAHRAVLPLSYTYNVQLGKSETATGVRLPGVANPSTLFVLGDLQLASSTGEYSYVPQTGQGRNNTIIFRGNHALLAFRHSGRMNVLFLDGSVAPRRRLVDGVATSPPEEVRWTPEGALTGLR